MCSLCNPFYDQLDNSTTGVNNVVIMSKINKGCGKVVASTKIE